MDEPINSCLIFLTYNDKMLLMLKDNRQKNSDINLWSFIEGIKKNKESFEEAIMREVAHITSLELLSVKLLTTLIAKGIKKQVYHAILTSQHLNNIKRGDGHNLDFFTLKEIEKLTLDQSTKLFLAKNQKTIEKILHT